MEEKKFTSKWLLIFFISIYFLTAGGHYYSSDGETIYLVTRALVEDGTIFIKETNVLPQLAIQNAPNGQAAPVVMPAQSIAMIPLYLFGKVLTYLFTDQYDTYLLHLSTSFFNALVTALTVLLFFLFLMRLGYILKMALITAGVFGLTTIAWPYSKFDFSEPLLSLFVLSAVYWAYLFRLESRYYQAFLAGGFLGLTVMTKVAGVIVVIPVTIYFLWTLGVKWRRDRKSGELVRLFLIFGITQVLFISILPIYNYIRFSSLFTTGYINVRFSTSLLTGLYGLFFSTGKGLLFYSPTVVLLFLGMAKFYRSHREEAVLLMSLIVTGLFFYAKLWVWHGDVAWGPRYLVYLIPMIMVPAVEVFTSFSNWNLPLKMVIVVVLVLGFLVQLIAISIFYNTYLDAMILKYPYQVSGTDLKNFWYSPRFSPLFGEARLITGRFFNWVTMLEKGNYEGVTSKPTKIFGWFLKPVPDFWWVYFSLSSMSRKLLVVLLFPLTGIWVSGRRLRQQLT